MREYDVNEAFRAADVQSGGLDIQSNGRLILSSLETNPDNSNRQWIHWQRCFGARTEYESSYGKEGDGTSGSSFKGMGPAGRVLTAEKEYAIMFAEVVYDYQPMLFGRFIPIEPIRKTAAMYVRDDRGLQDGLKNPDPQSTKNMCGG
jgi:hypothetical protein